MLCLWQCVLNIEKILLEFILPYVPTLLDQASDPIRILDILDISETILILNIFLADMDTTHIGCRLAQHTGKVEQIFNRKLRQARCAPLQLKHVFQNLLLILYKGI